MLRFIIYVFWGETSILNFLVEGNFCLFAGLACSTLTAMQSSWFQMVQSWIQTSRPAGKGSQPKI